MDAYSPTGRLIVAVARTLPAQAVAVAGSFRRLDGGALDADWTGTTDVFWDDGTDDTDPAGHVLWVDADGALWPSTAVVLRPERP